MGVRTHTQACKTPTEALSLCETQAGSGQAPKGTRWGPQQLRLVSAQLCPHSAWPGVGHVAFWASVSRLRPIYLGQSRGRSGAGEEDLFPVSHPRNPCPLKRTVQLRNFPSGHSLTELLLLPPFCVPPPPPLWFPAPPGNWAQSSAAWEAYGQVGKAGGRWGCPLALRTSSSSLGKAAGG